MAVPLYLPPDWGKRGRGKGKRPAGERECFTKKLALEGIENHGAFLFPICPALRRLWDQGGPNIDFGGMTTNSDMHCIGRIVVVCNYLLYLAANMETLALFAHRTNLLKDCLDLIRLEITTLPKRLEKEYPDTSKRCAELVKELEASEEIFQMYRTARLFLLPQCYAKLHGDSLQPFRKFLGVSSGVLATGQAGTLPGFEGIPFPPNEPLPEVECSTEAFLAWQRDTVRNYAAADQLATRFEGRPKVGPASHLVNYYPSYAIIAAGKLLKELAGVAPSLAARMPAAMTAAAPSEHTMPTTNDQDSQGPTAGDDENDEHRPDEKDPFLWKVTPLLCTVTKLADRGIKVADAIGRHLYKGKPETAWPEEIRVLKEKSAGLQSWKDWLAAKIGTEGSTPYCPPADLWLHWINDVTYIRPMFLSGLGEALTKLKDSDYNRYRREIEPLETLFVEVTEYLDTVDWERKPHSGRVGGDAHESEKKSNGEGREGENAGATAHGGAKPEVGPVRDRVFISYSHKDKKWLGELQDHLRPCTRQESVTVWSDENISPGQEWLAQIKVALASTKVAALLVTKDFLASEFIAEHEFKPLLEQAGTENVHIIWIPVGACAYKETELRTLQAPIDPDKPLAGMRKQHRDKAWVKICEAITEAVAR